METKKIDVEFIKPYFWSNKRHKNYLKAKDVAHHIQFHFNGYFQKPYNENEGASKDASDINPYFMRLIDARRPSESDMIKKFRRNLYLPITKAPCDKVLTSLQKIFKSSDWTISYDETETPKSLPENLSLYEYCENAYPNDNSIERWASKNLLRWMLTDPNGIVVVMPLSWNEPVGSLLRPYAHIIQSRDVFDYRYGEYFVFLSPYMHQYKKANGEIAYGKIITTVTADKFYDAKQVSEDEFIIEEHYHGCGEIPAWHLGGETKTPDIFQPYYDSFIQGMLPGLDAAACDFSDLQAEKVQHLFSTMWYYQAQNCNVCQGMGNVLAEGKQVICPECKGRGGLAFSPYRAYEINPNSSGFQGKDIPTPPMGYVTKDTTEMIELMRKEINFEIQQSFSAVHMEYLNQIPLNQSGVAKALDMTEANHFAYKISSQVVDEHINPIYWFTCQMRYLMLVPNQEEREKMIPNIPVPCKFDFLTDIEAEANMTAIVNSNASSKLKKLAEKNYINAKYNDVPAVINRIRIIEDHDPLPNYTVDEITGMVMAGLISKIDAVLHTYIETFAVQIIAEGEEFFKLEFEKQHEILYKMADLKMKQLDVATEIKEMYKLAEETEMEEEEDENEMEEEQDNEMENEMEYGESETKNLTKERIEAKKTGEKQRLKERDSLRNG
jgi:hypothetical protein